MATPGAIVIQKPRFDNDDARWRAVTNRDAEADGAFYYGVKTTGVYCRPSCPSRQALRQNVTFFDSPQAAEASGFRACKRCNPAQTTARGQHDALVTQACRLIETSEEPLSLDQLADAVGLSKHYFHRVFKQATGVTPKAYGDAQREQRVRAGLAKATSVTHAIYDSGFNSSGRFYEQSKGSLGMTPGQIKKGGSGETIRFALAECSLGSILVAATDKGICAVTLGDSPDGLLKTFQDQFPNAELVGADDEFDRWVAEILALVEGESSNVDLPLDIRGTAFQKKVWKALREIPLGKTVSYAEVAKKMGSPKSTRAVAQACGANKLAVVIPCHRVVRSDGALSGYRWGVERKQKLLDRESKS